MDSVSKSLHFGIPGHTTFPSRFSTTGDIAGMADHDGGARMSDSGTPHLDSGDPNNDFGDPKQIRVPRKHGFGDPKTDPGDQKWIPMTRKHEFGYPKSDFDDPKHDSGDPNSWFW